MDIISAQCELLEERMRFGWGRGKIDSLTRRSYAVYIKMHWLLLIG